MTRSNAGISSLSLLNAIPNERPGQNIGISFETRYLHKRAIPQATPDTEEEKQEKKDEEEEGLSSI